MGRNVIKYQVVWLIGTMTGRGKPFDEPSMADPWTVKHRGFLHAMVHDPTTVATGKPEARWAISSRRTRSDGAAHGTRSAAHAATLARLQIVTCGQALPLGSASGLWLGTVNSPKKQNARSDPSVSEEVRAMTRERNQQARRTSDRLQAFS